MILPTKHLPPDRALLTHGALIITALREPKPVSRLWQDARDLEGLAHLPFEWFVLALDLLFILGAVEIRDGRLARVGTE